MKISTLKLQTSHLTGPMALVGEQWFFLCAPPAFSL